MLFTIYPEIQRWLTSLGYAVKGRPIATLEAVFHREARQWQMRPEELAALIYDSIQPVEAGSGQNKLSSIHKIAA